ncbi:MAG: hypothetical protein UX81_C0002G0039 [Parcubacteria group bacterium GW2011_GWA2_47_12]|nr:MAG: hypothetical protein UX81_C0002G0039 [Parcubacteria group bacterium GW2011_GWA2_47_12]
MNMVSKEFHGAELEQAYAKVIGGRMSGGFNDCGKDIVPDDSSIPRFQVKSSVHFAVKFLAESVRRFQFTPICIGEPGKRDEVADSLRENGGWVGRNIPRREEVLQGITKAKGLARRA